MDYLIYTTILLRLLTKFNGSSKKIIWFYVIKILNH
jgi:hypothetical protein